MKANAVTIFTLCFVTFWIPSVVMGQAICVSPIVKISSINGRILANKEGLAGASIELRRWKNDEEIVRSTFSGDDGGFKLPDIKNGKYYIWVRKELYSFMTFSIDLNKNKQKRPKEFLVHMAPDHEEPCSRGGVEPVRP